VVVGRAASGAGRSLLLELPALFNVLFGDGQGRTVVTGAGLIVGG
jgi:hypothetical protein